MNLKKKNGVFPSGYERDRFKESSQKLTSVLLASNHYGLQKIGGSSRSIVKEQDIVYKSPSRTYDSRTRAPNLKQQYHLQKTSGEQNARQTYWVQQDSSTVHHGITQVQVRR